MLKLTFKQTNSELLVRAAASALFGTLVRRGAKLDHVSDYYPTLRGNLNRTLAFAGYQVNERGDIVPVTAARTLSEAEERADRLQGALRSRQVHPDVLKFGINIPD